MMRIDNMFVRRGHTARSTSTDSRQMQFAVCVVRDDRPHRKVEFVLTKKKE